MKHHSKHVMFITLVFTAAAFHAQTLDSPIDNPTRLTATVLAPLPESEGEAAGSPREARAKSYSQPPVDMWITPKRQVTSRAKRSGLDSKQIKCLHTIIERESSWNPKADNPQSSAYGLFQMIKLKPDTTIQKQITLGLKYITHRYGSPCKALDYHNRHGWY